jgi:hypothetical protein
MLLAACGGGGGDTADISGSGIVSGPVSGFGSIIANGTRMDIAGATVTNDGVPVTQADIDVGDSVVMAGTLNGDGTGSATSVITDEFLKGPVTDIDIADKEFVAMGQTVHVDLATVFDGVTLETLSIGQNVEVHGALDADREIRATRVELKSSLDEYEVTGFIEGVAGDTFTINDLIVNFAGAAVDTEEDAPLAAGMYVDVAAADAPVGGTLTATEVEEEDHLPGAAPGQRAEIQGIVTSLEPGSQFVLNGVTVQYGPNTEFEDGSVASIVVNAEVEVEGTFDANRVLQAREIEFERELNIRITTTVDAVNTAAGTVTILGKTFRTNAQTQFEDKRDADEPFRLSDLQAGDYAEIRGYLDGANLIAARVEREETDTELELRGPVDAPDPSGSPFSILGIPITTNGATEFEALDDSEISAGTFYALVGPNDVVEVKQDVRTSPIVADDVDIEALVP